MQDFHPKINIISELGYLDWLVFSCAIFMCMIFTYYGYRTKNKLRTTQEAELNRSSLLEYLLTIEDEPKPK